MKNKYFIYGANGFGREVIDLLRDVKKLNEDELFQSVILIDDNEDLKNISGLRTITSKDYDPVLGPVIIAIADPVVRLKVKHSLPKQTKFFSLIHPSAVIGRNTIIGEGAIICAGVVVTCNVTVGEHVHLNLGTTIGHDCIIGDYFTTAPSVNISGNCNVGDQVYFGTKAATKQGMNICSHATIGMSANVLKPLLKPGVYIGTPAKLLKRD